MCVCVCVCVCVRGGGGGGGALVWCSFMVMYCMVGDFCEGFIFAFFTSQEPFAKIKTQNFGAHCDECDDCACFIL